MTTLPCFAGGTGLLLVRVSGTDLHMPGTLWLLNQGETRKTKRVRFFTEFLVRRLTAYAPHLAKLFILPGMSPALLAMTECLRADVPSVREGSPPDGRPCVAECPLPGVEPTSVYGAIQTLRHPFDPTARSR